MSFFSRGLKHGLGGFPSSRMDLFMPKPINDIKIAKINAWQAIVVTLIGAVAGIAGTAGLTYLNKDAALSEKEKQIDELKSKIFHIEEQLVQPAMSVLRVKEISIDSIECEKRAHGWYRTQDKSIGYYDGKTSDGPISMDILNVDRINVRVACPAFKDVVVVSVSIAPPFAEGVGDRINATADSLMAVLQK
jgi:hypothetical protein